MRGDLVHRRVDTIRIRGGEVHIRSDVIHRRDDLVRMRDGEVHSRGDLVHRRDDLVHMGLQLERQTSPTPPTPRAQSSDDQPKQTKLALAHENANRMPGQR